MLGTQPRSPGPVLVVGWYGMGMIKARTPAFSVSAALLLGAGLLSSGCGTQDDAQAPPPGKNPDASMDGDTSDATDADGFAQPEADSSLPQDAAAEDAAGDSLDAGAEDAPAKPLAVQAQWITSSPAGAKTPPTWNAHLPKLAGDGTFLYAVHTYFTDEVATRQVSLMKRPAAQPDAPWIEAAKISYPHQPPGIVVDTSGRLHMVFECMRPGSTDVECFPGGAGTQGNSSRFYHLIFSSKNPDGSFLFDSYANYDEWTAHANGYHGIGTTADGTTWWSLADQDWNRVVQWWSSGTTFGTWPLLSKQPYYLLYPIHAAHPASGSGELILFAGEFDPAGGTNAGYPASVAYAGSTAALTELIERKHPSPVPGAVNAYPSDVAFDAAGSRYLLNYQPKPGGVCTELIRYDGSLNAVPILLDVGCVGNYANLQVDAAGVLYILTEGAGATMKLGRSPDKGASWTWQDVPIEGLPSNEDTSWYGMTMVKPYTSPGIYDPKRMVFFFTGSDASSLARHSYLGVLELP